MPAHIAFSDPKAFGQIEDIRNQLGQNIMDARKKAYEKINDLRYEKPDGYKQEFKKLSQEQIHQMDNLDHNMTWTILIGCIGLAVYYIK